MANDFVEIDNSVLRQVLHSRGISHGTLAKELNVTTKTIQRWLNGSVNRVHTETFKSLEKCLGLVGSELRKTEIDFEVRPVDPSLQILCDQDFYQRVRCNYDWHGYRIILKSYLKREIPTEQRLQAYKQIGAASLYMGEVQSGKYFFEKAYKIAVATRNVEEQVATLIWLGTRTELIGSFQQSLVYFREAEQLLPQMKDCYQQSNYHFLYGRLLHYLERHEEAIANLRKAIYLDLKYNKTRGFSTSVKYFHLIGVYLRTRDFKNGALMIQRSLRNTQRCAWVYGQSYSYFAELVWRLQTGRELTEVFSKVSKGRRIRGITQYHHIDCRIEQLEYFLCLQGGLVNEAKDLLKRRFTKNRRSPFHFSRTVLDALFLQKLYPGQYSVRPSFIERAQQQFSRHDLKRSCELLDRLLSNESINREKLLELFPF